SLGAQRADPSCCNLDQKTENRRRRFASARNGRDRPPIYPALYRSYDRSPIAPMGKRASAVARQEKRLSPSSRQTFRFSFLPPHDPIRVLTGAGSSPPPSFRRMWGHILRKRRQRLRPLAGLA